MWLIEVSGLGLPEAHNSMTLTKSTRRDGPEEYRTPMQTALADAVGGRSPVDVENEEVEHDSEP